MGNLQIKNEMIKDLRNQLKDFENLSHTDFHAIKDGLIKGREKEIALLLDRIDTDKNMTKEVIEDLITFISDFNSELIQGFERFEKFNEDCEKLKENVTILKTYLDALEKIDNVKKGQITINNNNESLNDNKKIDSSSSIVNNSNNKVVEKIFGFLSSKTGYVITIVVIYLILSNYYDTVQVDEIIKKVTGK